LGFFACFLDLYRAIKGKNRENRKDFAGGTGQMNGTKWIIAALLCITAVSGFCGGTRDKNLRKDVTELQKDVSGLKKQLDETQASNTKNFQEINKKLDAIIGGGGGGGGGEQPSVGSRLIPVSLEIIERSRGMGVELDQLDYFLSANVLFIFNETEDKLERKGGSLVETKQHKSEEVAITTTDTGRMKSDSKEYFHISFSEKSTETEKNTEKNITLKFERNNKLNRYELVSASRKDKNYKLTFEKERPYLFINYPYIPNEKSIQVQGVTTSLSTENSGVWQDDPPKRQPNPPPYNDTRHGSIRIEGRGSLPQAVIVRYIRNENRNISQGFLEKLIDTYIREAGKEGINYDLAIAQMLYWTNHLRNNERVNSCNYGGLNRINNVFNGTFPRKLGDGMTEGVRAHIQHLKGYTSLDRPTHEIVDPRWEMLSSFRGTIKTLEELSKRWVQNSESYEAGIKSIIERMQRFSA
jgi:cell division protein FtsB